MCVYMYIYMYMYTYTYTYICTLEQVFAEFLGQEIAELLRPQPLARSAASPALLPPPSRASSS